MITLGEEPKILSMAHSLGIHEGDPVEGIKSFCRSKVSRLISGAGRSIHSIDDLEQLICERLNITIIEVWSEADLTAVIEKYAREQKELGFAALRQDLDSETFATLLRRLKRADNGDDCYVAVIDCRGEKGVRRFFTRWHEIAHVLTQYEQLQFPLHRSTIKKDPVERMMDIIAGDIGFLDELFKPILQTELVGRGRLTFASAENVRNFFCPSASFEATMNACASRVQTPLILVQAAMGLKKEEELVVNSLQSEFFPSVRPSPQLRVMSAIPNGAARAAKIKIPNNMRVPKASVIWKTFDSNVESVSRFADENLNLWRSSDGKELSHARVHVEARRIRDRVWAIVTLDDV
jgi:hypothetical protein